MANPGVVAERDEIEGGGYWEGEFIQVLDGFNWDRPIGKATLGRDAVGRIVVTSVTWGPGLDESTKPTDWLWSYARVGSRIIHVVPGRIPAEEAKPETWLYVAVTRRGKVPRACPLCKTTLRNGEIVQEGPREETVHVDCARPWPDGVTPAGEATLERFPSSLADRAPRGMRGFSIERKADTSGVSGTGIVLEGVIFSTGAVVAHWLTPAPKGSLNTFDSWDQFVSIHLSSHPENEARVLWADGDVWAHDEILGRSPWIRPSVDEDFDQAYGRRIRQDGKRFPWRWAVRVAKPGDTLAILTVQEAMKAAASVFRTFDREDLAEKVEAEAERIRQQD